jgi:hypothetical protein
MSNTYNRAEVLMSISDVSKEAYGFRIRHNFAAMADEELFDLYDRYLRDAQIEALAEVERETIAKKAWNDRICNLMNRFGISRKDALRWDLQAEGCDAQGPYGVEDYCYLQGFSAYINANQITEELA